MNAIGELPSGTHATEAIERPSPRSIAKVAGDVLFRSTLIGAGMAAAGVRKHVVAGALGGSLAVEAFVLAWVGATRRVP